MPKINVVSKTLPNGDVVLDVATHPEAKTTDPAAPLDVHALPAYWDDPRLAAGKDASQCAADLRRALEAQHAKKRPYYLGAHDFHALNQACRQIAEAYGYPYLVGSCLERPDYRDVDVRCILDDEEFARLFPGTTGEANVTREHGARLALLNASISFYLSRATGLPIDFQFQQMTLANKKYPGRRNALGMYIERTTDGGRQ